MINVRTSPSHQRYLDLGCTLTRTELGKRHAFGPTEIHYYDPCRQCGQPMRDVDERGYEDCSGSPYTMDAYGPPDATVCTRCAHETYMRSHDLTGRQAQCSYSRKRDGSMHAGTVQSDWGLAFFEYRGDKDYDAYYCGCWGWD